MPDLAVLARRHGLRLRGVVHVGAHKGEEVETYRTLGVQKMLLVEANPEIHAELAAKCAGDPTIVTVQAAASDRSGSVTLRVSEFSQASSLLRPALTVELYPFTRTVKQIEVEARRLDRIVSDAGLRRDDFNLLNIDVQGAELMVLRGAEKLLAKVEMVNVEVNFDELYEDAAQIEEIDKYLGERGFRRVALACPYDRSWGDAVYVREDSPPDYSSAADCPIPPLAELLATHLGRLRGGSFVEVGAYDGHTASSTSFLADLGWRGLYVEPVAEHAAMRAQRHRANHRVDVANVAVIGLDDLLTEYRVEPRFDLLVVDVAGAEAEVFDSFSLDKWRPKMLIVDLQDRHPDRAGHAAIASRARALRDHLTRSGYAAVWEDQTRTVLVDRRAEDSRSPIARLISRFRPTTR
jgi:FkbM family methyltransferase